MLVTSLSSTRSLLHLQGLEAAKFLQGLVTNDILRPPSQDNDHSSSGSHAVYAGFLSAQGRVLHDTFILPSSSFSSSSPSSASSSSSSAPEFLIDYPSNVTSPSLPSYIKRYILRSKVKSKNIDDQYRLWAIFNDPLNRRSVDVGRVEEELRSLAGENGGKWWRDTRSSEMGYRLLLPPEASNAVESSSFTSLLPSFHSLLRTMANVPEAPTDLIPNSALPLESNMDIMGGIDFRKGCYIGQELTARTYHTGVIRKRMMPVRLYPPGAAAPTTLLPDSWSSIKSITPLSVPTEADIRPSSSSSSSSTTTRRPRPAGKLSSLLRVTGQSEQQGTTQGVEEEEVYLGLALLRLESSDGEMGMSCSSGIESRTVETSAGEQEREAGVNAAGELLEGNKKEEQKLEGEWMVKAFKESLEGAK